MYRFSNRLQSINEKIGNCAAQTSVCLDEKFSRLFLDLFQNYKQDLWGQIIRSCTQTQTEYLLLFNHSNRKM